MASNRYNWSIKYNSRADLIAAGVTCVFISYQQQDRDAASKISDYLIKAGISVYFDILDVDLKHSAQNNNPRRVTEAICKGINNSSHMIVVVSPNTIKSSWVPFEIGYGFEKTDLGVLCLKGFAKGSLPEYLRTAKVIRDVYDLNILVGNLLGKEVEMLINENYFMKRDSILNPLNDYMDSLINDTYL